CDDLCSGIHPSAVASPFFKALPVAKHGLEWIEPPAMLAHPVDAGPPAVLHRSFGRRADGLGRDARAYRQLVGGVVRAWPSIEASVLGPLRWPAHPFGTARFGLSALRSAQRAVHVFDTDRDRALFGGIAAHGML